MRRLGIYGLPDAGADERNWEISNADSTEALLSNIDRGVITVQYQLSRQYHLLMD